MLLLLSEGLKNVNIRTKWFSIAVVVSKTPRYSIRNVFTRISTSSIISQSDFGSVRPNTRYLPTFFRTRTFTSRGFIKIIADVSRKSVSYFELNFTPRHVWASPVLKNRLFSTRLYVCEITVRSIILYYDLNTFCFVADAVNTICLT